MIVYSLKDSPLDDMAEVNPSPKRWYYGCGRARLAVNADNVPVALAYSSDSIADVKQLTTAELLAAAGPGGHVLKGMCSCFQFCADEVRMADTHSLTVAHVLNSIIRVVRELQKRTPYAGMLGELVNIDEQLWGLLVECEDAEKGQ